MVRFILIFIIGVMIGLASGVLVQNFRLKLSEQADHVATQDLDMLFSEDILGQSTDMLGPNVLLENGIQNATVVTTNVTSTPPPIASPLPPSSGLLSSINRYRTSRGWEVLQQHDGLCGYAQFRQGDIMNGSHGNFMQGNWQSYCPECSYLGENLSFGYSDDRALSEWLSSDAHKVNIEGDWKFGCVSHFPGDVVVLSVGK